MLKFWFVDVMCSANRTYHGAPDSQVNPRVRVNPRVNPVLQLMLGSTDLSQNRSAALYMLCSTHRVLCKFGSVNRYHDAR